MLCTTVVHSDTHTRMWTGLKFACQCHFRFRFCLCTCV